MDKVPRKKKRKGLKKPILLLILLLGVLLCAGGICLLRRPVYSAPHSAEKTWLLNRPKDEIRSLAVITDEYGTYPLVRGDDGSMYLAGQEDIPLREDVVEDYLNAASQMEAAGTIWDSTETITLSDFGLENPALRLVVGYKDGEKKEILVGDQTPEEDNTLYYCMVRGEDALYTMLDTQCEIFFHDAAYLRAFTQPRLDASLLDEIRVTGEKNLTLSYTPVGWQMLAPHPYPADPEATDALLARIESMAFEACLGDASALRLKDYGLENPALTVTLTQAATVISGETEDGEQVSFDYPSVEYTLKLGAETGKSGVYLLWDGQIFRASNFLLGFWKEIDPDALLLRKPVNFLTNQLIGLRAETPEKSVFYVLRLVESIGEDNQVETDEYGKTLYDVEVEKDGAKADASQFLTWYTQVAALSPAGRLPGDYKPGQDAACTLTLQTDYLTRTLSFVPYDSVHDALVVDGCALFYVDREYRELLTRCP